MPVSLHSLSTVGGKPLRRSLGFLIVIAGGYLLFRQAEAMLLAHPHLWRALQGGMLCSLGTALGALPVLLLRRVAAAVADGIMGAGVGVMLAATSFSLILPGLDAARALGHGPVAATLLVSVAVFVGAMALFIAGRLLPQTPMVHELPADHGGPTITPRVVLFVVAIILHNIPEGMAVGVSFGAATQAADALTMGIALQNVPEGLIIALVLVAAGMSRVKATAIGVASGLVEPLFAVLCAWLVGLSEILLPWGLALAAGAMLFVITHEIIPELHRKGNGTYASLGLTSGFCLMMVLGALLAR